MNNRFVATSLTVIAIIMVLATGFYIGRTTLSMIQAINNNTRNIQQITQAVNNINARLQPTQVK